MSRIVISTEKTDGTIFSNSLSNDAVLYMDNLLNSLHIGTNNVDGAPLMSSISIHGSTSEQITEFHYPVTYHSTVEAKSNVLIRQNIDVLGTVNASAISGGGSIPIGGIIMWSGTINDIPVQWVLCDGTNGTPNLIDRFVVSIGKMNPGEIGGSENAVVVSHSHSGTTANEGSHSHSGSTTSVGDHRHSGSTSSAGHHSHSGSTNHAGNHLHNTKVSGGRTHEDHQTFINTSIRWVEYERVGWQWDWDSPGSRKTFYKSSSAQRRSWQGIAGNHNHSLSINGNGSHSHSFNTNYAGGHNHSLNINDNGSHNHTFNTDNAGQSGVGMNMPPFYALAFIMRVS